MQFPSPEPGLTRFLTRGQPSLSDQGDCHFAECLQPMSRHWHVISALSRILLKRRGFQRCVTRVFLREARAWPGRMAVAEAGGLAVTVPRLALAVWSRVDR